MFFFKFNCIFKKLIHYNHNKKIIGRFSKSNKIQASYTGRHNGSYQHGISR